MKKTFLNGRIRNKFAERLWTEDGKADSVQPEEKHRGLGRLGTHASCGMRPFTLARADRPDWQGR